MMGWLRRAGLALLALAVATVLFSPSAALAGGSDDPPPYIVTADGLTLPTGDKFPDGGHVNVRTDSGSFGIHFESLNNQPSGQWIGHGYLPWSALGITGSYCIEWVQVSLYNEHYGEGGQQPVCTPSPTPEPTVTPTPESSVTPVPQPTPTEPVATPTPSPTATAIPQPSLSAAPPAASGPVPPTDRLAATGSGTSELYGLALVGAAALILGAVLACVRYARGHARSKPRT